MKKIIFLSLLLSINTPLCVQSQNTSDNFKNETQYYDNGSVESTTKYDKENGILEYIHYSHYNGSIETVDKYDEKTGTHEWIYYNHDGSIENSCKHNNNTGVSTFYYHPSNRFIAGTDEYDREKGTVESIRSWNGKVISKIKYNVGTGIHEITFYKENGDIERIDKYNEKTGIFDYYNGDTPSGDIKDFYQESIRDGENYKKRFSIVEETEYNNDGSLSEKTKEIDEDGPRRRIILQQEKYEYATETDEHYNEKRTNKIRMKSEYNGKTETISTFYDNGNIKTKEIHDDINTYYGNRGLLDYKEYTEDGKEYLFNFMPDTIFESCLRHGSLGADFNSGSYCRPYKKYLDGILISSMDEKQIYTEFYPDGKIKLKCDEVHKRGSDFAGEITQKCVQYFYNEDGSLKKEENKEVILSSWIT